MPAPRRAPDTAAESLRLAMFSPLPPTPSGIGDYVVDLLPLLPETWSVDVFVGDASPLATVARLVGPGETLGSVEGFVDVEFERRQERRPYDLIIYQVGNSTHHAYMLPYALHHPGLLVLHDGVLHPSRAQQAIESGDLAAYRRAVIACRPDVGAALGHLVAGGLAGPALYFRFPMCEDLVRASRLTAVHGEVMCGWVSAMVPESAVIPLVHWRAVAAIDEAQRQQTRRGVAGASQNDVLIGCFGSMGAERRLDRVFAALARLGDATPWRLVLAGNVDASIRLPALADELGIGARIAWPGRLDDAQFQALMGSVDMAVNLRYPPARSSSGVLHQLLQVGAPTIISDVLHWCEYPEPAVARVPPGPDAAETEALQAALQRWISDPQARREASAAGRCWAAEEITAAGMANSYVAAVSAAMDR